MIKNSHTSLCHKIINPWRNHTSFWPSLSADGGTALNSSRHTQVGCREGQEVPEVGVRGTALKLPAGTEHPPPPQDQALTKQ